MPPSKSLRSHPKNLLTQPIVWVGLFLVVGAILRFIGLNFGSPLAIKSDEPIIVYNILYMFENRTFEPDTFQWPGHLLMQLGYLSVTIYSYLFLGLRPEEAVSIYPEETWYPAVRFVTALFGIATIVLAYFLGKFINKRVGIIASALFALFPYFVEHSHYSTVDMGLTALVMGVMLASMHYLKSPGLLRVFIMAIIAGAAFTMKYPGALTTVLIATAIVVAALRDHRWVRIAGHGLYSLFWFGLSAFLISPALLTNRHEVIRSIGNESKTQHPGADGRNLLERLEFYALSYFQATGLILLAALLIGIWAFIRLRSLTLFPLLFGFFYWIVLSFLALFWLRWGLPMFVTPLILTALGIDRAWNWLRDNQQSWTRSAGVALASISALSLLASSVAESTRFLARDTRVESLSYFDAQSITEETAFYEGYSPIDAGTLGKVFTDFSVNANEIEPNDPTINYLVLSSGTYGRYFADEKFTDERHFYELVESKYPEIYRIEPDLYFRGSAWEPINIWQRAKSISSITSGGISGPVIRVLDLQNPR